MNYIIYTSKRFLDSYSNQWKIIRIIIFYVFIFVICFIAFNTWQGTIIEMKTNVFAWHHNFLKNPGWIFRLTNYVILWKNIYYLRMWTTIFFRASNTVTKIEHICWIPIFFGLQHWLVMLFLPIPKMIEFEILDIKVL